MVLRRPHGSAAREKSHGVAHRLGSLMEHALRNLALSAKGGWRTKTVRANTAGT